MTKAIALLCGWALALPALANTLRYDISFPDSAPGGEVLHMPGRPMVPVVRREILIPYAEEVTAVRFEGPSAQLVPVVMPETAPYPRTLSTGQYAEVPRERTPVGRFPESTLGAWSVATQRGYRLLEVALHPLQVDLATREAFRVSHGQLVVETRPAAPAPLYRGLARDAREVVAAGYGADGRTEEALATYPRSWKEATLDYLIIAPQTLLDDDDAHSLNRLLFEKNSRGMRTAALSMEKIEKNYPGADTQEKIRKAITAYYQERGIQYVLLVGNGYTSVPTRKLSVQLPDMNGVIPSDFYYACLDGDFTGGSPDLACEVAVGRAPVSNADELHAWIAKTLLMGAFEDDDVRLTNLLNFGEVLDPMTLGSKLVDQLLTGGNAGTLSTVGYPADTMVRKLYETQSRQYSQDEVIEAINSGQFYTINHIGHCDEANCMRMTSSAIDALNNDIPYFAFTQGCHPGNISRANFASKMVVHAGGGAGAMIANSNYGFYAGRGSSDGPSNRFQLAFYDTAFREKVRELGKIHFRAKARIAPQVAEDRTMLWVIYETNLLGDPELALKVRR